MYSASTSVVVTANWPPKRGGRQKVTRRGFPCKHSPHQDYRFQLLDSVAATGKLFWTRAGIPPIDHLIVAFGHERIGLTRNGKLVAVVIGVEDLELLELLEQLEDAQELAAYRAANAEDNGERISLPELRDELGA